MRFRKFGKAVLIGALSLGVVFGVTSCVESYTVGYLYVTGTETALTGNNGIISGYKIDHNTGRLAPINGLPVSSDGANPVRAVLVTSSRFLYVLNRGVNAEGNGDCTTVDPCTGSNITQFIVGGNGILTEENIFYTEGINPFRLISDASGSFLLALDHDAPSSAACQAALGGSVTSCGDVTVFAINQTTGRLSVVQNDAVTAANCPSSTFPCPLTYFPVPANPVDFVLSGQFLLTLTAASPQASYPYSGGGIVWPYSYSSTSGQLTLSQNSAQPLVDTGTPSGLVGEGNSLVSANGVIYVLDNEPVTIPPGTVFCSASSPCVFPGGQILPYSVSTGGSLSAETGGIIPDTSTLVNPIQLLVEKTDKYIYVANQGNNTTATNNPNSGIAAYYIESTSPYQLNFVTPPAFGSGSGPQCIVEDPSSQFIYEANQYDSSITGRVLDPTSGNLDAMHGVETWPLQGPPTWCLVDGRTG
jgi:6-phosphogluconolactonase (cycloisomerase 2 family)